MSTQGIWEGATLRQGAKAALPIMFGYFPLAFAYGILAVQAGLNLAWAASMSVFVYAGASQFMAVAMLATGGTPATIIFAVLVVNLRHLLMSAAVAPKLGHLSKTRVAGVAFHLTDETFAVMSMHRGVVRYNSKWLAGLQWGAYLSWVTGSAIGAAVGASVPDPSRWGLDFALVAMFIALLAMQVRQRSTLFVAVTAALAYKLSLQLVSGNWSVIIAAMVAATLGTLFNGQHLRRTDEKLKIPAN